MKKNCMIFAVAMLSLVLVNCSKKDEVSSSSVNPITTSGALTISVDNGAALSSQIDSVICSIGSTYGHIVGRTLFKSSGLTLNLISLPDNSLSKVTAQFNGYTISDPTALTSYSASMWITAVKGSEVGHFFRTNVTLAQYYEDTAKAGYAEGDFIYSNKAVTITKTDSQIEDGIKSCNLNLKKGWNEVVYIVTSETDKKNSISVTTNNEPNGMKWLYVSDANSQSLQKNAKIL